MIGRFLALIAVALWGVTAAHAATGDRLDRAQLSVAQAFAAEFNEANGSPLSLWSPANPAGTWKVDYYFGFQRDAWPSLTQAQAYTARHIAGERQVYADPAYCGRNPFWVGNGRLYIYASKADAAARKTCGQGSSDYLSGLITTQKSFSQVRGYFEIRAILPSADGTWPAFWLLPRDKTAANLGRIPEIDVFEHYAGPVDAIQVAKNTPLNRTGLANITVHLAPDKAVQPAPQPRTTATLAFHTYGVLWTATELVFYLDEVETWRMPFVYDQPMYLLVNLAVSDKVAGDPAKGVYPAALVVDWVRAWGMR